MKYLLSGLLFVLLLVSTGNVVNAADLEFDSFKDAEAAAQKRAQEYQQKMDEHMKNVQEEWEAQQKDLGADNANPDITKITESSDGQRSSDTNAANSMEDAVNSSVNNLKNTMINTAGPNSTGFAGGGAGYQWSVKNVGGKYVLSDSYNEADFGTGKKKDAPAKTTPEPAAQGSDNKADAVTAKTPTQEPAKPVNETTSTQTQVAKVPDSEPSSSASSNPGSSSTPGSSAGTPAATTPDSNSSSANPAGTSTPATPGKDGQAATTPATPGIDPAPANLPPPKVRLVIQHPTDFSEEIFASNTDSETASDYGLEKFRIPEDTRVKIAVEVSDDIDPEDVSLVIVDEEGERDPVAATRMGNYRHMFRVPSEGNYSANVYVTDKDKPGNQKKKLMQVKIPVSKVEFDSRTIDNQRGTQSSDGSSASKMSTSTSSSGSVGGYSHSSQGQSQQVDLSDLYSNPDANSSSTDSGESGAAGSDSAGSSSGSGPEAAGYNGSSASAGSSGSSSSESSNGSSGYSSGQEGAAADGNSGYSGGSSAAQDGATSQGNSSESSGDTSSESSAATENGQYYDDANNTAGSQGSSQNGSYNSDEGSSSADSGYGQGAGNGSDYAAGGSSGNSSGERRGGDNYDGTGSYQSGDEQAGSYNEDDVAANRARNENGYHGEYASANGVSSSSNRTQNSSSGSAAATAVDEEETPVEEDNFIVSIGLRSEAHKIYQSFDFSEGQNQTSTTLPAGSEIIFNIVLGKQVAFDSVNITMADGGEEFSGDLRTMGEAFAYSFKNPSPESYIQVSGKAAGQSFSYRVKTPVTKK